MDEIDSKYMQEEQDQGINDLFELDQWDIPNLPNKITSIATSQNFLYIVTEDGEILRWTVGNPDTLKNLYPLPQPKNPPSNCPDKITKIFCDRKGNHAFIKHAGRMYYFNGTTSTPRELNSFKGIEVYAIAFDQNNTNLKSTGEILISDSENRIYSYSVELEQGKPKEQIQELIKLDSKETIYGLEVKLFNLIFSLLL
ncbi:MAG: hypothetical protein MJ252_06480 [archaeon]|nr:hypothetical protein [archaeon]